MTPQPTIFRLFKIESDEPQVVAVHCRRECAREIARAYRQIFSDVWRVEYTSAEFSGTEEWAFPAPSAADPTTQEDLPYD